MRAYCSCETIKVRVGSCAALPPEIVNGEGCTVYSRVAVELDSSDNLVTSMDRHRVGPEDALALWCVDLPAVVEVVERLKAPPIVDEWIERREE